MFKQPLFYLIVAPKRKSNNAGNSEMPQRSQKVLPLSEKVKILDLIRGKIHLTLLRFMVRMNLL